MLKDVAYPMGSDANGDISSLFGVYVEENGMDLRGAFIINPEGRLMNAEVNYYNLGRNIDELLRKLKANIHMAENQAEVCPAKWRKEGDATLTPSEKLVGNVYEALNKK